MPQINVLFRVKVKAGREDEFYKLAGEMGRSTRAEDEGCITFTYHRHTRDPNDFFLCEQWRDREALQAHLDRLKEVYGPVSEGDFLPASLMDFWDVVQVDMYNVVD
tara:strand:+ start:390 stop:707 length:318 start_codon:yes stop_codon:yes gene_type:complete